MNRDQGQLQSVARVALRPLFSGLWRIKTVGLENIPEHGPAILAPNHTSVIDSFFLPAMLPRRITFVGKAEYLDDWKTRRLFPALGMIPIDRGGGDASTRALDTAARLLEEGELFGIYPEGTRARDGCLHKGHTGAARLSLATGAPIIPVGILGTRSIQPPDASLPKPFRPVEIRFGRPIRPPSADAVSDQRMRLRQITDELMFDIQTLTGQRYIDEYATKPSTAASTTRTTTNATRATSTSTPATPRHRGLGGIDPEMPVRRSSAEVLRPTAV